MTEAMIMSVTSLILFLGIKDVFDNDKQQIKAKKIIIITETDTIALVCLLLAMALIVILSSHISFLLH